MLLRTDSVRIDNGPVLNSSSSSRDSSSGVISDFGFAVAMMRDKLKVTMRQKGFKADGQNLMLDVFILSLLENKFLSHLFIFC